MQEVRRGKTYEDGTGLLCKMLQKNVRSVPMREQSAHFVSLCNPEFRVARIKINQVKSVVIMERWSFSASTAAGVSRATIASKILRWSALDASSTCLSPSM